MITRQMAAEFSTRAEGEAKYIEGHFAVYDSPYWVAKDGFETVASGAFTEALARDDVRALINHDTTLVLGRTAAGTLTLTDDGQGLYGRILVNEKDQDAVNCYERIKRGDVNQCSFGFEIVDQDTEVLDDGTVHWTIKNTKLYEVSVCTYPAYSATDCHARGNTIDEQRERDIWRIRTLKRINERMD